ncbi:MAG TPA: hypothetical protein DCS07_06220 [Bdellovibrionales bacterium]|nr:MAG: hypothetical protein A2Z97_13235 [Bdellovibrionales bacterium GWB1_52_6]OFZ05796.1 MAG: hypothetical protein A2X97_03785 [Bdellovibrionales bacterium GWA1_52_35]OFZ43676.1 MAG: hypothetical protein A2070_02635 [Bdellovibrionales bacterium GWC1_52_8]HAR42212.1 hypothetical protein [Bdellovibrionales bacterium]HCM40263.1 hypothetical protein [Bdellovibrionales bacterium]
MYQKYLEQIVEEFTTGEYYREVYQAKQEYFDKSGVVYEDDHEFEQRMSIFMDWYLFDRDLPGVDLPPIKFYFRKQKDRFSNEELNIYRDFCLTLHSIFRVKRFTWNRKGFVVADLFSGKTYKVIDSEINAGFARGDIFEARLIPFKGSYEFSRGFCFHPVEMESFILGEIKKVKSQEKKVQTKLILQLAAMKLKHQRFQHIDIKHIYTFASKF